MVTHYTEEQLFEAARGFKPFVESEGLEFCLPKRIVHVKSPQEMGARAFQAVMEAWGDPAYEFFMSEELANAIRRNHETDSLNGVYFHTNDVLALSAHVDPVDPTVMFTEEHLRDTALEGQLIPTTSTLLHELVHVSQHKSATGMARDPAATIGTMEAQAYTIQGHWLKAHGFNDTPFYHRAMMEREMNTGAVITRKETA